MFPQQYGNQQRNKPSQPNGQANKEKRIQFQQDWKVNSYIIRCSLLNNLSALYIGLLLYCTVYICKLHNIQYVLLMYWRIATMNLLIFIFCMSINTSLMCMDYSILRKELDDDYILFLDEFTNLSMFAAQYNLDATGLQSQLDCVDNNII